MADYPIVQQPDDQMAGAQPQVPAQPGVPDARKKVWKEFRAKVSATKEYRKKLIPNWTLSIDYRRGKPYNSAADSDRVVVPLDWSLTKSKQAALFSQVPAVRIDHPPQSLQVPWLHTFEQRVNDMLNAAGIESAMDEILPDVINAAGFGVTLVSYESLKGEVEVPAVDLGTLPPEVAMQVLQSGQFMGEELPMTTVPKTYDQRYLITRISPSDFLWPLDFVGSDFDQAPWLGRSGRVSWARAVALFNLADEDKEAVLGDDRQYQDRLTNDVDKDKSQPDEKVSFDEIYYKETECDPEAKSFVAIRRLVFISGKDEPVIDEAWEGQAPDEETEEINGAQKYPIRVLTLTYISDEAIPPSDTAIGRPQVDELNKSRTFMILQRQRSLPVRWANVDRLDPTIRQSMMRGTWQAFIPVQGTGGNVIGEIARAAMPNEDFVIDKIVKADLSESWQTGPNQVGDGGGIETKGEAEIIQAGFSTRVGRERAKVARYFCGIAEVLGGLIAVNDDPARLGQGFAPGISRTLTYSILADSTVLLDSNQKLQRLMRFVDFTAKSGFLNLEPVLKEIATLTGLDPNLVIQPPQPRPPVEPNISLRLTGAEDMMNPLTLAFLMKSGQAPPLDLIEQAKQLILASIMPPPNAVATPEPPGAIGPNGEELPSEGLEPGTPPFLPTGAPMDVPPSTPMPPMPGGAHPDWGLFPTVGQRTEDEK